MEVMDKLERLQAFGRELRERREAHAMDQKVMAMKLNISGQHLSQLETAYHKPGRPPVGPSDDVINAISHVLEWRKYEIQKVLGRLDDDFDDSDFQIIAEAYEGMPPSGRRMLKVQAQAIKKLLEEAGRSDTTHGKKAQ